jgi:hypothetical protein
MGFSGLHNIEKNLYEPKHQLLIQELVAWSWRGVERRCKKTKDKPLPAADTETDFILLNAHGPSKTPGMWRVRPH